MKKIFFCESENKSKNICIKFLYIQKNHIFVMASSLAEKRTRDVGPAFQKQ